MTESERDVGGGKFLAGLLNRNLIWSWKDRSSGQYHREIIHAGCFHVEVDREPYDASIQGLDSN